MSQKPPLVILPGWGGDHTTWKNFIDKASEVFEVTCIDLPCFGDEPCPSRVWGVEEYADFVERRLATLNITKPILLGHSFGGQIASLVASRHPEQYAELVLIGAAALRPRRLLRRMFFACIAKCGKVLFRFPILERADVWGREMLYKAIGSRDYNETSGTKRDIFKKITREDLSQKLPLITTPTLVIWGTRDRYVPLRDGKKISRLIPNASLKIIQGGGHGLHLTHADELLRLLGCRF